MRETSSGLTLLPRLDQTTSNYYRNFKWQRGKSVTPIVGSAAPVCGSFTTPMLYQISYTYLVKVPSSSWFFLPNRWNMQRPRATHWTETDMWHWTETDI